MPPSQGELSQVECKAIALDRACVSCHHWIYYADTVNLVSDCRNSQHACQAPEQGDQQEAPKYHGKDLQLQLHKPTRIENNVCDILFGLLILAVLTHHSRSIGQEVKSLKFRQGQMLRHLGG